MKRNLLQLVTLISCIILLIITVIQGRKLDEYQIQMENRLQNMENTLNNQLQNVSGQVEWELREAQRQIDEYTLEPAGIDSENRVLLADVSVTLKQWYEDTEVILLMTSSGEEREIPMESDGHGGFYASLTFPLDDDPEIELKALISGGGLTTRDTLDHVSDFTMLLPLRSTGGGWSGPEYRDGILSCSYFSIDIEGRNGEAAAVNNPEFLIFRNGKLAQTVPAVSPLYGEEAGSYRPNNASHGWELECQYSDIVEVFFRCEDEFGLGYEFPFQAWVVDAETDSSHVGSTGISGEGEVNLFWPE